ncbi:MAG: DNA recombination protein RmuC [Kiritimatiellae bacterium]|nr:DNA recombination protein RmuC [Kiritimatiellia bacterium]
MTAAIAIAAAFAGIAAGALAVWALFSGRVAERRFERMLAEMRNFAADELARRERELASRNAEQVKNLLAPMHQRLDDFAKAAEASKKTNGELGVKIEDFFKGIRETSASFGAQAKSFTDALTGANKKQGNWGEAILGRVLEDCGLEEGKHYLAQTGSGDYIPDYQIFDPGSSKILVVDSKMSWTKYEQAYRMPEGEERRAALREHAKSVRNHIDALCKTDYPNRLSPPRAGYSYVPLTAMFVPCDAALSAALESDPSIVDYACKRNIALVSPLTLFGFLILVSRAWSRYDIDRNTENIREEARKLVGYVDRLFRNLEDVGDLLAKATQKHEAAMQLAAKEPSGQCVKGPALKIISLGVKLERELKSKALSEP